MKILVIIMLAVIWTGCVILTCKHFFTPPVKGWIIVEHDNVDNETYLFLEPINKPQLEHELLDGHVDYVTFRVRK